MPFYIFGKFGEGNGWSYIAPSYSDTEYTQAVETQADLTLRAMALGRKDISFKLYASPSEGHAKRALSPTLETGI
jgi:hypothetical protein